MTESPPPSASLWAPLKRPPFRNLMGAVVVSNTGYFMQTVAAAYLMRLWSGGDPFMVSLVQTALFIPPVLLLLPAGALVDMLDRRRFMIFAQGWMMVMAAALTVLVVSGVQSPWLLLAFLVLYATGYALNTPSQSAIWAEMVGLKEVPQAVALYSLMNNGARIVGPSVAGALIPVLGAASMIAFNALAYTGVIAALVSWRRASPPQRPRSAQPWLQTLFGAFAFARTSPPYRALLIRGGIFFVVSSVFLAILPSKAPEPDDFGAIFSFMGLGAILGVLCYQRVAQRYARDWIVAYAIFVNALALLAMAFAQTVPALGLLTGAGGFTWFFVMSSIQVGAQMVLPDEMRGRGMALINLILMGGYAFGSPLWGVIARLTNPNVCLALAGCGSLAALALTYRMKLPEDRAE
ncbi:MAG: MFS transporter [Rhodospirillaceae bacterium]|nr:MFS transporter [Rhodospirillaceae bacterium]